MKKISIKSKPFLGALLSAAIVLGSLSMGFGQIGAGAVQAEGQRVTYCIQTQTSTQAGSGTDSSFKLVILFEDGELWFSDILAAMGDPDPLEPGENNVFYVNGPAKPITSMGLYQVNSVGGLWIWDWIMIFAFKVGYEYYVIATAGAGAYDMAGGFITIPYNGAMNALNRTLTFDGNGGTVNGASTYTVTAIEGVTYPYNATNAPAVSRTGYTFNGWDPPFPEYGPAADTTYYAQWAANRYYITFDANGGTGGWSAWRDYGSALTPPTVTRTGYTFTGWSPSPPGTVPASDATYTAQWSINSYTITFNGNGGTTPSPITKNYGTSVTAPTSTRTGYTFTGWSPACPSTMPASNTTCAAQWSINSYTVTFNANGGSGSMDSQTIQYGASVVLSANAFTRTYHTFAGWNTAADGSGTSCADGAVYGPMGAASVTLYAQWNVNYSTITFGSYPQTKVTETDLISNLNAQTLGADSTVTYGGSKYKRVYFTQYTPIYPGGPYSLQDDNGYYINTVYWFKFEPIQWRVLSNANGELFIMAEKILESGAYNQVATSVTWETCTLRSWLNIEFYNTAFNATEQARITSSPLVNENNPFYGTDGGSDTCDKVFLLSYSDYTNHSFGFDSDSLAYDNAREVQGTDFAKSGGLWVHSGTSYSGNSQWWLRTTGNDQGFACIGYFDGHVGSGDCTFGVVDRLWVGVRPVLKLNLLSPILTSKAASTCVVDYLNGLICGLAPGIHSLEDYAQVAPGYTMEYVPTAGGFGTGTVVNVKLGGETAESYRLVIFGDVNGDGNIDSSDAGCIVDYENFPLNWDPVFESARLAAGDLNGDGNVDTFDSGLIVDVENFLLTIDQITGLAS